LKQGLYRPMHVTDQVLSIFAGSRGYLDKVPVTEVAGWLEGMLCFVRDHKAALWQKITDTKDLDNQAAEQLAAAMNEYQDGHRQKKQPAKAIA